ncbi:MAG: iron dicitrate transport regulator FecR [Actinobacteria bacterium]|nr:iron dicitrate transport regulator FecR [Actinomycetota bacterium]
MKAAEFLADLEAKPTALRELADTIGSVEWPVAKGVPLVLTGMGSSWFAAETLARRLRRAGVHAIAEMASVVATLPADPALTVVAITASGVSEETVSLLAAHYGISHTVVLTNTPAAAPPADYVLPINAGIERGGVACRSYTHTLAMLLQLEHQLAATLPDLPAKLVLAAEAIATLIDSRGTWLPTASATLAGPNGCWLLAPAERLANASQGALMIRECPRRPADGCETGDWNHVDVYLTKSIDYRALVFSGSRFDSNAVRWMRERRSRFVAVGAHLPGAETEVRYPGDDDAIVALLTEVSVAELIAADWWLSR